MLRTHYNISVKCKGIIGFAIIHVFAEKKIWEVQAVGQLPLGSGSYGEVVKVTYKGKAYAAKKIKEHFVDSKDEYNDRIIKEFQIISKLFHPNIVRYCALGKLPNIPLHVLVMELMKTDLHQYLIDPSIGISIEMKKGFLNDVAKGLKFLHSNMVWHRNLTAKNVLLDDRGTAKISDFGVVNSDSGYTRSTLTSTPGLNVYMPPEVFQPVAEYNHLIDIFSFGHLGLFVLVQEFPSNLLPEMYKDAKGKLHVRDEVERREKYFAKIPPNPDTDQIVELVKKCLEFSPEDRPDIEDIIRRTKCKCW